MAIQQPSGTCPDCGHQTLAIAEGSSVVVSCSSCPWSVVTTNYDRPECDATNYDLYVAAKASLGAAEIATLAVQIGQPAVHVKDLLSKQLPLQRSLKAIAVIKLSQSLHQHGLSVVTTPPFPWPLIGA